jgi:hypothetical protein
MKNPEGRKYRETVPLKHKITFAAKEPAPFILILYMILLFILVDLKSKSFMRYSVSTVIIGQMFSSALGHVFEFLCIEATNTSTLYFCICIKMMLSLPPALPVKYSNIVG